MRTAGTARLCLHGLVCALLLTAHTHAPHAQAPPTGALPVIGILEVPGLFGTIAPDGQRTRPGLPLQLRRQPAPDATIVATIGAPEMVETAEFTYEEPGALVYGRAGNWSLLRTSDGTTGWIGPPDGGPFHSLEQLLGEGLTYLTDAWDGTISPAAGERGRVRVPPDPRRRIVGILDPRTSRTRVVLQPGEDPEQVRARYRASGSSVRPQGDGTRIMELEVGTTHPLFERPDRAASIAGEVATNRAGDVLASSGSVPARVPVFDRQAGWFQVVFRSGRWQEARRVWLEETPDWRFQALDDETEAERFMSRVWGPASMSVRVAGFRRTGDQLWINVEVLSDSPCETTDEPAVIAQGWIRAHAESGGPAIWFHSRGC